MAQLTRNEIVLLLQNILPWGSIGMANEILLTLETNGILCLVEGEVEDMDWVSHNAAVDYEPNYPTVDRYIVAKTDASSKRNFKTIYRNSIPTYHCKKETQGAE